MIFDEQEAVYRDIESRVEDFYEKYDRDAAIALAADKNANKEKVRLHKLLDVQMDEFETLKNGFSARCRVASKAIQDALTIIGRKEARLEALEKNVAEFQAGALAKEEELKALLQRNSGI